MTKFYVSVEFTSMKDFVVEAESKDDVVAFLSHHPTSTANEILEYLEDNLNDRVYSVKLLKVEDADFLQCDWDPICRIDADGETSEIVDDDH